MQIKIGCDPELFAFDGDTPVSVHGILPGNKVFPHRVPKGAIQVDGVAAEFNITPARNSTEFLLNIKHVTRLMSRILHNKNPNLKLRAVPTALFSQEYFDSLPFMAKELGCEPDYSAYTLKENPKPKTDKPFRTASGHVHIQFRDPPVDDPHDWNHMADCGALCQHLDNVLLPVSRLWDNDEERRQLYGSAGSFRPKTYGVEYRVLSNRWIDADWTIKYVFDTVYKVTEEFIVGTDVSDLVKKAANRTNSMKGFVNALASVGLPDFNNYAPKEVVESL